ACLGVTAAIWTMAGCGDGGAAPDAAGALADAAIDAPVDAPDVWIPTPHLLITEVGLTNNSREFIEIFNPTSETIDLSHYYLSDDADYAILPGRWGAGPVPQPNGTYDFSARVPDGATIRPRTAMVVAFRFDEFQSVFEYPP